MDTPSTGARKPPRGIYLLPNLFTTGAMFAGFYAIVAAIGGHYTDAIKHYDKVIEQYPASNKVPVSRLHKGNALIESKQTAAGVRELRSLIQRYPNAPEAMQARSKLSGMGVPVTPRR